MKCLVKKLNEGRNTTALMRTVVWKPRFKVILMLKTACIADAGRGRDRAARGPGHGLARHQPQEDNVRADRAHRLPALAHPARHPHAQR